MLIFIFIFILPAFLGNINTKDEAQLAVIEGGSVEIGLPETQIDRVIDLYRIGVQAEPELSWLKRERPNRTVKVKKFMIYSYEITNRMFQKFVNETKYKTQAEREGFGYVMGTSKLRKVFGANWKSPQGPASSINKSLDHPVVQVTFDDAMNYAKWASARLPTEPEWIKAATGDVFKLFPWGNYWKDGLANGGRYPQEPAADAIDGYLGTAPVGHYKSGKSIYGCYDMSGNVWELTETSEEIGGKKMYIIKGGAWFSNIFCLRISCKARIEKDFRCDGLGFRLVKD
ncbi:MAG: SUMF1/EgtB/PvdO family nonheme iron enzyme [Candidatus Coatesbacteria bacterium]|nr:SUMF1/EgtB/PvdO family nonheme iron enzyme [Candidatus Coatesbacteria bacterium]